MAIERVNRRQGSVWRVRWREADGRERSRVIGSKADARLFEAELVKRRRMGQLSQVDAGQETLGAFVERWWSDYAVIELQPSTLRTYATLWDAHIESRLGGIRLRDLAPSVILAFRSALLEAGTGRASVAKTLTILQSVLRSAVEQDLIASNPVAGVRKPVVRRQRQIEPLAPAMVEAIRLRMLQAGRPLDAALVTVMAYAGLRPGEALALQWRHVRANTILVEQAAANGVIKPPKTNKPRTVRLVQPLRDDLQELASGSSDREQLVFPGRDGDAWNEQRWRNWRKRIFAPAARAAGINDPRPYDLRHSFVSLLIYEGRNPVEVAQQAGHSPSMCLSTYAHIFAEVTGIEGMTAEDAIRAGRKLTTQSQRTSK